MFDSLRLVDRGEDYQVQLRTGGDSELELWAADRHADAFEDLVGKPVHFEAVPAPQKRKAAAAR